MQNSATRSVAFLFGAGASARLGYPMVTEFFSHVKSKNDGLLTASEIQGLKISADWVILSACKTAAAETGGEEMSSLAKAFLFAGAQSLLASNWRVDDAATVDLITSTLRYYANGASGVSKSQALQKAMEAMRRNPRFSHPRYWAPFSLISNVDR